MRILNYLISVAQFTSPCFETAGNGPFPAVNRGPIKLVKISALLFCQLQFVKGRNIILMNFSGVEFQTFMHKFRKRK